MAFVHDLEMSYEHFGKMDEYLKGFGVMFPFSSLSTLNGILQSFM